jgi:hypothetical protein
MQVEQKTRNEQGKDELKQKGNNEVQNRRERKRREKQCPEVIGTREKK